MPVFALIAVQALAFLVLNARTDEAHFFVVFCQGASPVPYQLLAGKRAQGVVDEPSRFGDVERQ